ncbi:MAG TPA: hypothetical protein VN843_02270, partial [Anaerolineales bacterium]|nr:hypothetical protein [Anaerolineales bacterium]
MEQIVLRVIPANAKITIGEDPLELIAHKVDDHLKVQLGGKTLLNAVDDREFGVMLLGLFEQAL